MKKIIYSILFFLKCVSVFSQNLVIDTDNILIAEYADGGFHMWIKSPDDIKSILITESTADPKKKNAVYAFRSEEFNPINGNEKRILDGKIMIPNKNSYFLIDSTPEEHEELGKAFHIFIPYIVQYGYPWTRNGEIYISAGTFINIRSFEKPFADYSGAFNDNPFRLNIIQVTVPVVPLFVEVVPPPPVETVVEVMPPVETVVEVVPPVETVVEIVLSVETVVEIVSPVETVAEVVPPVETVAEVVPPVAEVEKTVGFFCPPFSACRRYGLYGVDNGKTNRSTWVVGETIMLSP